MTNPDPANRLADMEAAVAALGEMISHLPTGEDAERAVRVERQVNRIMAWAIVPTLLTLGILVFAVMAALDARDGVEQNYEGVRCILEQLAEHRHQNQTLNEAIARATGADVTEEDRRYAPPPIPAQLVETCDAFYPENGPSLQRPWP